MTISLYFSNRLEDLAEIFSLAITRENQEKKNILESSLVIVPNQNLAKWLQLTLAKEQSVFMNVDFQYLDAGLWNLIEELDEREDKPVIMDHALRRMLMLYAMQTLDPLENDYEPLRHYLFGSAGRPGPDYGVKVWQLTERMVHLFEEYEFHRTDMLQAWMQAPGPAGGMERCQRRLYLHLQRLKSAYREKTGIRILSLGEYAGEVLPPSVGPGAVHATEPGPKRVVHIFGLSQVSAFHLNVIGRLGKNYAVCLYVLNPSREFWEDVKTPSERRWLMRKKVRTLAITPLEWEQGDLLEPEENELLALWGKPGRENIRLLCELTDYDFHACFTEEKAADTVLQKLQQNILTLSTQKNAQDKCRQDRSLQIFACPGIYREVETVYNSILHNLETDRTLRLTDIAILVSDISRYKPVIDSFFHSGTGRLSYNLVDSRADTDSVYAKGLLLLLEMASGRFSRKEVFDLIANPCFMQKWRIHEAETGIWATWADQLNIFHSFDADAKKKRGYWETNEHTWKQGLQRLRLSRILAAPTARANKSSPHFQGIVPFSDAHTGDLDTLEKFSFIIEKLHHAATELAGLTGSGEEWSALFLRLCDELLEIPPDFKGEAAVQQALIKGLLKLKVYDQLTGETNGKDRAQLNFEIMREYLRSNLGSISGGRGDYLTEGVTVSALQPMRPIPFKVVYVLGMEEGAFPGKADASSLDLRLFKTRGQMSDVSCRTPGLGPLTSDIGPLTSDIGPLTSGRRIGDVSLPERNCYLFLEMLLSVREKLYISYVSKDLQKDRAIQPCSVVTRLRRVVEREILKDNAEFRVVEIPLKGSSVKYLAEDAQQDFSDVMVNYSLADRISCYREQGVWEEVRRNISQEEEKRLQRFFPDFGTTMQKREEGAGSAEKISVRELRRFLEDPVSQGMKRHLRIYEEEETVEDISLREDEPFYSVFPVDYNIKMEALSRWLDFRLSFESHAPMSDVRPLAPDVRCPMSDVRCPTSDIRPPTSDLRHLTSDRCPRQETTLEAICNQVYENFQRRSETPEGAYAALDQEALEEEIVERGEVLAPVIAEMLLCKDTLYRAFFVGDEAEGSISPDNSLPLKRFKTATLTVPAYRGIEDSPEIPVQLRGQLPWVWRDAEGIWHALVLTGSGKTPKAKEPDKYVLEPLLFWMVCLLAEEGKETLTDPAGTRAGDGGRRSEVGDRMSEVGCQRSEVGGRASDRGNTTIILHVAYRERLVQRSYRLHVDEVLFYLRGLIPAFLDQENLDWLPFETVTSRPIKPQKDFTDEPCSSNGILFREQLLYAFEKEESALLQLAAPQIPHDAYQKVRKRFRIFFSLREAQ